MVPMGGPQSSPCPTPAMQGHSQSTGPKLWPDGKYSLSVQYMEGLNGWICKMNCICGLEPH